MAICFRLSHQICSIDETCNKIAQNVPKSCVIYAYMEESGGVASRLSDACASVWRVTPLPLKEVLQFIDFRDLLRRCLAPWFILKRLIVVDRSEGGQQPNVSSELDKGLERGSMGSSRGDPRSQPVSGCHCGPMRVR